MARSIPHHREQTYRALALKLLPWVCAHCGRDFDGKKLSQVSQRRYFCTQCHVPQAVVDPLVENRFQGRK